MKYYYATLIFLVSIGSFANKSFNKENELKDETCLEYQADEVFNEDLLVIYEFTGETLTPSQTASAVSASDFQVSEDELGFGNAQPTSWSGSGVPYANSQTNWDATSAEDAKYFFFNVNANENFVFTVTELSFEWRSTANGPSAISVEIDGEVITTFDAEANSTTIFSTSIANAVDLSSSEVRIYGWDNGSRDTDGSGFFRINDVRLNGATTAVSTALSVNPTQLSGFGYQEGAGPSSPQSFQVLGFSLDGSDVTVSLENSSDFELSLTQGNGYLESLTLNAYQGEETNIFVRLKSGLAIGTYTEEVTISGGGAESISVSLTAQVIEDILVIYEFTGEVLTPAQPVFNATASLFQVTGTNPTFNSAQASSWSGSGVPVAQSGQGWDAEDPDEAKFFFFTLTADVDFAIDLDEISFQWRSTANGPSAITVEVNGIEIDTFDAPQDETAFFSAPLSFTGLSEVEVRIKGWDNGSRDTPGSGILRVNDVRLDGSIESTLSTPVFNQPDNIKVFPNPVNDLLTIEIGQFTAAEKVFIELYDIRGKKVLQQQNNSKSISLDMSQLTKGTYLLRLTQKGESFTQKVIKK